MNNKQASELEYLRYFYEACYFGPAHDDVIDSINENFIEKTGKGIPREYVLGWEDEDE